MATEISVIVDASPPGALSASPEERALAFESMACDHNIPLATVDAFAEMYDHAMTESVDAIMPTIIELLLRRVIVDGAGKRAPRDTNSVVTAIRNLVVPVVAGPPGGQRAPVTGGAFPRMTRAKPTAVVANPDAIRIRFDTPTVCIWAETDYIAPAGEEIEVIGMQVNARCDGVLDHANDMPDDPISSRMLTGRYTYNDIWRACDGLPPVDNTVPRREYVAQSASPLGQVGSANDKFLPMLREQFARLRTRGNAHVIYNAISSRMPTVKRWPPSPDLLARVISSHPIGRFTPAANLLEAFEAVHWGRFTARTVDSIYADMALRGFAHLYHRARLMGRDDTEVRNGLAAFALGKQRAIKAADAKLRREDDRNALDVYRMLIGRVSPAKLRDVDAGLRRQPSLRVTPGGVLTLLSPADRKTVELEYRMREKYITESMNNNCPHVKLYRDLRRSTDDRSSSRLLAELRGYLPLIAVSSNRGDRGATTGMLACKRCKYDIMCPHTLDYIALDLAKKSQHEIKVALTKYVAGDRRSGQLDCKICGEVLSNLEEFDAVEVRLATSSMDEELRNMMWGELSGLMRHLKFAALTDVRAIITTAREAIYQHIFDFEKQIIKSKTASTDEIGSKLRLYVAIYGMAYLVRLVERASGVTFRDYKGKSTAAELVKHGLDLIMMTRNVVIREISGMTLDVIKNAIVAAYKSLTVGAITAPVHTGDLMSTLMLDPIYNYYYTMDLITSGRPLPPRKHDREDRVSHIMGAEVTKLERKGADANRDIYAKAVKPKMPSTEAFTHLTEFKVGGLSPPARRAYVAASFEWFDHRLRERAFVQHQYIDVADKTATVLNVQFRPVHQAIHDTAVKLLAHESVLDQYRAYIVAQPYGEVQPVHSPTRRWSDPHASLSRVFDETGAEHRWTKYLVKIGDDPVIEVTTKSLAADADKPFAGKVIDRKCAHCGQLESAVGALSETKIRAALRSRHLRNNFFRFYEHRCPAGGLHESVVTDAGVAPCSKCGLAPGTTPAEYFAKYASTYADARHDDVGVVAPTAKPMPDTSKFNADYADWTYDFSIVLDLASKISVNHRLLSALGAYVGVQYADILSGAYIPGESDDRQSTRAAVVNSHVHTLLAEYNRLRYYSNMLKPPYDLAAVVDASNYPRHLLAGLESALPDVYDDYNERYLHVSIAKRPREIVEFCIQAFCQRCLRIWSDGDDAASRLRRDFVTYVTKKILRGEELMTKPGHFNWSLLHGDAKEKAYDSNTARDEPEEQQAAEDTEDDPMTTDAFDVEPGDDDDGDSSNTIRLEGD